MVQPDRPPTDWPTTEGLAERQRLVEARERTADVRDRVAGERERAADRREAAADARELAANERERAADRREMAADARELAANERERELDAEGRDPAPRVVDHAGRLRGTLARGVARTERGAEFLRRSDEAVKRGTQRLDRLRALTHQDPSPDDAHDTPQAEGPQ